MGVLVSSPRFVSTAFVPTNIAGCVLWLDPSDASTISTNSTNLLAWSDKSAAGNHCVIAFTSNLVTGSRTINSRNVLDLWNSSLDGSIYAPVTGITTDLTVFIVHQWDMGGGQLFDFRESTNGTPLHDDENIGGFGFRRRNDANNLVSGTPLTPNTNARVFGYRGTPSNMEGFANGVSVSSSSVSGTISNLTRFYIGHNAQRYDGAVGEVIVYNTALSVANRETVDAYLRTKWGTP